MFEQMKEVINLKTDIPKKSLMDNGEIKDKKDIPLEWLAMPSSAKKLKR